MNVNLLGSAAHLREFEEDFGLSGNQLSTILSILYVGYVHHRAGSFVRLLFPIRFEPSANFCTTRDSNMFLNHIGKPSIYLPV